MIWQLLMTRFQRLGLLVAFCPVLLGITKECAANPYTAENYQTISAEIDAKDIAVIARRVTPAGEAQQVPADLPRVDIVIAEVIKGDQHVRVGQQLSIEAYRAPEPSNLYLLIGKAAPVIQWETSLELSGRAREYVRRLTSLSMKSPERLKVIYAFLEDQDEFIARDAYDEFAAVDLADLQPLKPILQRDQLVKWIRDRGVPQSRRQLYLRLLSICGSSADLPMLESVLQSPMTEFDCPLGVIDCYLALSGAAGLPLVEDRILRNQDTPLQVVFYTEIALRIHATERNVIPREQIARSMRFVLGHPQLADIVIKDFMQWEDWSAVDDVFAAFQVPDEKQSPWVRVAAIQYLRRCPLQRAKEHLRACQRLDPHSIHRANLEVTKKNK